MSIYSYIQRWIYNESFNICAGIYYT